MRLILPILLLGALLSGCAGPTTRFIQPASDTVAREKERQEEFALKQYVGQLGRLYDVAWPVREAGHPLCIDRQGYGLGLVVVNENSFDKEFAAAPKRVYGLDQGPMVLLVVSGSPADAAGLRTGDVITAIDGNPVPTTGRIIDTALKALDEARRGGRPFALEYIRERQRQIATIRPASICDYPLRILNEDAVNAFADGNTIYVTRGMMDFVHSDAELAEVISHELAHNAMRHIDAKRLNALGGFLVDLAFAVLGVNTQGAFTDLASRVYSKEFEAEADYVGLYLMARADYPIDDAPALWRRMAGRHPESIKGYFGASHPSSPERFVALEATVREIHRKQQAGEVLLPNIDQEKLRTRTPPPRPKVGFASP